MTIDWKPDVAAAGEPIYLAIARAMGLDVASGRLKPGDRLPSQRELAATLGVALGTVTRAYAEAERRGLTIGRGRRGTIITDGPSPKRSGLRALMDTGNLIDLSANHPSPSLDPDLPSALRALARRPNVASLLSYPPPEGLRRHREAMAAWLRQQNVPASADALVMTAGAQHAISVALDVLTEPGDVIACEALTYPGIKAAAHTHGVKLHPVRMDEKGLVPEDFDDLCRKRAVRVLYTIPTLHNPTSVSLGPERRERIARIAEKHAVTILEDEIHRPFPRSPGAPFVARAPGRSVLVSSVSKSVAGGLRVGCVLVPPHLNDALAQAVQSSLIAAPPMTAEIVRGWIDDGEAERTISARRKEMRARHALACRILREHLAPGSESCYAWLELPGHWPRETLVSEARTRGVAVASAELFAVDSARAPNAVRLALCAPASRELLARGLEVLRGLLDGTPSRHAVTL